MGDRGFAEDVSRMMQEDVGKIFLDIFFREGRYDSKYSKLTAFGI